jgi:hypothetical protein
MEELSCPWNFVLVHTIFDLHRRIRLYQDDNQYRTQIRTSINGLQQRISAIERSLDEMKHDIHKMEDRKEVAVERKKSSPLLESAMALIGR